jgi:hypothetical protein
MMVKKKRKRKEGNEEVDGVVSEVKKGEKMKE